MSFDATICTPKIRNVLYPHLFISSYMSTCLLMFSAHSPEFNSRKEIGKCYNTPLIPISFRIKYIAKVNLPHVWNLHVTKACHEVEKLHTFTVSSPDGSEIQLHAPWEKNFHYYMNRRLVMVAKRNMSVLDHPACIQSICYLNYSDSIK
jgi:hypothetical protein